MVRIDGKSGHADVAQVAPLMESFKMMTTTSLESPTHSTAPLLWREGTDRGEMKTSSYVSSEAGPDNESLEEDPEEDEDDKCDLVESADTRNVPTTWNDCDGLYANFCDMGEPSPTNHLVLRHMLTPLRAVSFRSGLGRRSSRRRHVQVMSGEDNRVSRLPSSVAMAVASAAAAAWQEDHPALAPPPRPMVNGKTVPTPVMTIDLWDLWIDLKKQPLDGDNDDRFHSSLPLRQRARQAAAAVPPPAAAAAAAAAGRRSRLDWGGARQMLMEVVRSHELWGLASLDLSCSRLGDRGAYALADGLLKTRHSTQSTLRTLSLRRCNLTSRGVHYLCLVLRQCPYLALQTLSLTKNRIDGDGARWLGEYLSLPECRLAVLFLRSNNVDDRGLTYLARALGRGGRNTSLVLLSLAKNSCITARGVAALSRALAWNRTLRVLNLGHNRNILRARGGGSRSSSSSSRFSSCLGGVGGNRATRRTPGRRTPRLFSFPTSTCCDHDDGIKHLTAGLSYVRRDGDNAHAREDDDDDEDEEEDYRSRVAWTKPAASCCSKVVALDLRFVPLNGRNAMLHICDMLTNTPRLELRILALSCCQLGDKGVEQLARSGCGSLLRLWLDGNGISCVGATAMANFCLNSPTCQLKTLSLRDNQIGMEGVTAIAAALSNNCDSSQLMELHLQHNKAPPPPTRRTLLDAHHYCLPDLLDSIARHLQANRHRQEAAAAAAASRKEAEAQSTKDASFAKPNNCGFSVSPMSSLTPSKQAFRNDDDDPASLYRQQVQHYLDDDKKKKTKTKKKKKTTTTTTTRGRRASAPSASSSSLPDTIWSPTSSSYSTVSSLTKPSLVVTPPAPRSASRGCYTRESRPPYVMMMNDENSPHDDDKEEEEEEEEDHVPPPGKFAFSDEEEDVDEDVDDEDEDVDSAAQDEEDDAEDEFDLVLSLSVMSQDAAMA